MSRKNTTKKFEVHQRVIENAFMKIYESTGKAPSIVGIAKETGLARDTVYRHMQSTKLDVLTPKQRVRLERVLNSLADKAEAGDVKAIRLYLEVVADFIPKQQLTTELSDNVIKIEFVDKKETKE